MVKIYHRNGKYGFVETQMDFNSVHALIAYYRSNSLGRHNKSLDVTLKYPVSKLTQVCINLWYCIVGVIFLSLIKYPVVKIFNNGKRFVVFQVEEVTESNNNIENVKQTLLEHHSEFRRLTQQYDKLYEEHSRISQVRLHCLYCVVIYVNWEGRKKRRNHREFCLRFDRSCIL